MDQTKWLHHISGLMRAALVVVNAIDTEKRPVLVHCSDGWDRTPQIVALAELMLDPYYRTLEVMYPYYRTLEVMYPYYRTLSCRAISGCLRPTRVDDLFLLCGIAPPHIRRAVSSQLEKLKQENDPLHPLYEQDPARKRL